MAKEGNNTQKFDAKYKTLNTAQKKAVDTIDGPVLVVAGPGSGKTQVLTMRAGNILKQTDTNPSNILCLTFTESAAMNMSKRLADLIGKEAYKTAIHTFHSFGVDVIGRYPEYFFGGASFYPADTLVQLEVLEGIFERLSYDDPLSGRAPKGGYVFLSDAGKAIQNIKKAGFTAGEFKKVIDHNALLFEKIEEKVEDVFASRMSKKTISQARVLLGEMAKIQNEPFPARAFHPLSEVLTASLSEAVSQAEDEDSTKPLSAWKRENTKKNAEQKTVLKDAEYLEKMRSLGDIYERYANRMYELQYYDYEDMLLEVIKALETYPELQSELWEQFQYVQVDEFQDTNDAQMRLLYLLTESDVTEGRPNICAVGDDDQAIYKFQGALVSNILDFRKAYRDPEMIVLTENYRSTQDILELAQFFIRKGDERLEKQISEIEKTLVASNPSLGKGDITSKSFPTDTEEYSWVAREIRELVDNGEEPRNITVISRNHKELTEFSKYLDAVSVPTFYERNQNVFDEPHVHQLVQMARFVTSLMQKNTDEADEYLPEILSFPFWELSRTTIWDIATRAEREKYHRQKWIDVMLAHDDENVRDIAEFFLEASTFAKSHTLFDTLDLLIGEHTEFSEFSDEDSDEAKREQKKKKEKFQSPFKAYYFSDEKFEQNRLEYLNFLSALQVFVSSVREYRQGEVVTLSDLVTFVDRHEEFHLPVVDKSPFVGSDNAVTLLSAHKAKGLEFGTVFILSCQDDIWAKNNHSGKLPFPKNLPLEPAGETADDHLRLFFVAVTRAKERLYMTSYEKRSDGKDSTRLRFFDVDDVETSEMSDAHSQKIADFVTPKEKEESEAEILEGTRDALTDYWEALHAKAYIPDEEAILRKLLENYQMSPTHLNNFLNVSEGGPAHFLEQSLLHFPQAKGPALSYGTAMHGAIEDVYKYLRTEGELPTEEHMLEHFRNILLKERMTELEYQKWVKQGEDALSAYFREKKESFDKDDRIEANFKHEGVVLGGAHLTGKIDKMIFHGETATVVDFKTGKPSEKWQGKSDGDKQKLRRYENQLIFYKLLVENSEKYGEKYTVGEGVLEYLEPKNEKFYELRLEMDAEKTARLRKLIEIVYEKIMNLDFPDTSEYSKDVKGIEAFEEDLLAGRI